jgi:DNA (cytosine-5)-methyltransferase 1
MHLITDDQKEYLGSLSPKDRQKEILKEEYRNGEWYADDIGRVDARDLPRADCWCFGFPCQDISICGSQVGFYGNRSSLFFRVMYLVGQLQEEERPTYLFIENVKNLLSVNWGWDFARLLTELDRGGYDAEWQVLDSSEFGVPQHRERTFVIGHLRGRSRPPVFPLRGTDPENNVHQIGMYSTAKRKNSNAYRLYDTDGLCPTLNKMDGGGREPNIPVCIGGVGEINYGKQFRPGNRIYDDNAVACAITANPVGNCGVPTAMYAVDDDGLSGIPHVWYEKRGCNVAIRKLTPKECFRLQGWTDKYFKKAKFVNSDSQLYKQAGNGVTVNVIQAIAERMS